MNDWILHTKIEKNSIKRIKNEIDNLSENCISLDERSTRGLNSTQYILTHKKDKLKISQSLIIKKVKECIEENVELNIENAWTVLGQENSYHLVHKHHNKKKQISVVVYLSIPKKNNLHQSGAFYCFLKKNEQINYLAIQPELGSIFIFPSNVLHGAYPQSKGLRQTLNFDFSFNIINNKVSDNA